eukprot:3551594-Lingulodinium_polyedra.AAC.1
MGSVRVEGSTARALSAAGRGEGAATRELAVTTPPPPASTVVGAPIDSPGCSRWRPALVAACCPPLPAVPSPSLATRISA